jgi:hypothetical protein
VQHGETRRQLYQRNEAAIGNNPDRIFPDRHLRV